jgi:hypothetical protein
MVLGGLRTSAAQSVSRPLLAVDTEGHRITLTVVASLVFHKVLPLRVSTARKVRSKSPTKATLPAVDYAGQEGRALERPERLWVRRAIGRQTAHIAVQPGISK